MARFRLLALIAVAIGLCGLLNLQPRVPRQVPPVAVRSERLLADTPERIPAPREVAVNDSVVMPAAVPGEIRLRHERPVCAVAFRPDGKVVASAAYGSPVIEWDVKIGREVRRYPDTRTPGPWPSFVGYSPDGRRLIATHKNSGLAVCDTTTGETICRLPISWVVISPDGKTGAGFDKPSKLRPDLQAVAVWDLETGKKVGSPGPVPQRGALDHYAALCFSPDGKELAASVNHESVYVLSVAGDKEVRELPVRDRGNGIIDVTWGQQDRITAIWNDGSIDIHPANGQELARRSGESGRAVSGARLGRDGCPVAVSRSGSLVAKGIGCTVRLIDAKTGKSLHPDLDLYPIWPTTEVRVSADSRRVLTISKQGSMRVWDAATRKPIAAIDDGGYFFHPQLTPDGRWVVGIDGIQRSNPLVVWEADTGKEVSRQPLADDGRSQHMIGIDPEGHAWVAGGGPAGEIARYEIPSGKVIRTLAAPDSLYTILSRDGKRMAVAGFSEFAIRDLDPAAEWKVIARYEAQVGKRLRRSRPPCPLLETFTPDGRLITWDDAAIYDANGRVTRMGDLPRRSPLHFSSDGRRFAHPVEDPNEQKVHGLSLCETATFAEVTWIPLLGTEAATLSPDGRKLVLARVGGVLEVRDWDWYAEELQGLTTLSTAPAWTELASRNPKVGLGAVRTLVASNSTVTLLSGLIDSHNPTRVAALITELGDEDFETREKATASLAELGWRAEAALREAHAKSPSPEARNRAWGLLQKFKPADGRTADEIRMVRAVEVLERIGSAEARELLARWAKDYPGTVLAAEATAAGNRLAIRK